MATKPLSSLTEIPESDEDEGDSLLANNKNELSLCQTELSLLIIFPLFERSFFLLNAYPI